ncbi:hypothetical protein [Rossellomorea sp. BNER]|nr:hypothetical protein [Rossellomorea sp. BNER]
MKTEWEGSKKRIATFIVNKDDIKEEEYRFVIYDSMDNVLRKTNHFRIDP